MKQKAELGEHLKTIKDKVTSIFKSKKNDEKPN